MTTKQVHCGLNQHLLYQLFANRPYNVYGLQGVHFKYYSQKSTRYIYTHITYAKWHRGNCIYFISSTYQNECDNLFAGYFESLVLHLPSTCEGTREMAAGKTEGSPKRSDRPAMDSVAIESTFTVDREKVCACVYQNT